MIQKILIVLIKILIILNWICNRFKKKILIYHFQLEFYLTRLANIPLFWKYTEIL